MICDIQRGGPSTGLPTKTEQADLLQAMFGRNGEAPLPIIAPSSPVDCFDAAIEAVRIATTYRTPVMLLSDGYLANGSEPWLLPEVADLPDLRVANAAGPNAENDDGTTAFRPYLRDPETLARPWAPPGTPGLEHRIGGIEKADVTGDISYDPDNHDLHGPPPAGQGRRHRRVDRRRSRSTTRPGDADVLVLGWGSTYGPIAAATRLVRGAGGRVARAHLRHLNPFPANTGEVLGRYRRVLVPEMNLGQLALLLRAKYLVDAVGYNRVRGLPFMATELAEAITDAARGDPMSTVDLGLPGSGPAGLHGVPRVAEDAPAQTKREFTSDQEVRWCPGCGDYAILATMQGFLPVAGAAPGEHRLRLGHRLLVPLPLLPGHLRPALDPRPGAGHRHRAGRVAAGPLGLGRHRRRRRALDRRQPPDPRVAAQREPQDPALQQPDLRADQGPVLPDLRGRQGHQVDAGGQRRQPVQPDLAGARRRGDVRGPDDGQRPGHLTDVLSRAAAHRGHGAGGDLPELPDLQRRRRSTCSRTATQSAARLVHLRHGEPITVGDAEVLVRRRRRRDRRRTNGFRGRRPGAACTTPTTRTRRSSSRCPGWTTPTLARVPVGVFREVSRPTYDDLVRAQIAEAQERAGGPATDADLAGLLAGHDTWTVAA